MINRRTTPDTAEVSRRPRSPEPIKLGSPVDLDARSWRYVARRTVREFGQDQCTDQAAALTYYSVLAIFPAALALVSVLGLVGQASSAVSTVVEVLRPLVAPRTLEALEPVLREMAASQAAGLTLVAGLLGALWSASAYVNAFSRAMNRIYEVREGRPFWKRRPLTLLVTVAAVALTAVVLVLLVVSGPLAESLGAVLGVGGAVLTAWSIVKWPVLALVVVLVVALLYYATPNVRPPRFRWISVGAALAILVWVVASAGFAFYVANVGSYDRTYGSLAGVVITLLWLWITNLALLFGAELDSELERGRQLQSGMAAEVALQLPLRDARMIDKQHEKMKEDIKLARAIRLNVAPSHVGHPSHDNSERTAP